MSVFILLQKREFKVKVSLFQRIKKKFWVYFLRLLLWQTVPVSFFRPGVCVCVSSTYMPLHDVCVCVCVVPAESLLSAKLA